MLSRIDFSIQSRTVKTEIMQKIPIVIPKRERKVRSLLIITELTANRKPSLKSRKDVFNSVFVLNGMSKVRKSFYL